MNNFFSKEICIKIFFKKFLLVKMKSPNLIKIIELNKRIYVNINSMRTLFAETKVFRQWKQWYNQFQTKQKTETYCIVKRTEKSDKGDFRIRDKHFR